MEIEQPQKQNASIRMSKSARESLVKHEAIIDKVPAQDKDEEKSESVEDDEEDTLEEDIMNFSVGQERMKMQTQIKSQMENEIKAAGR